MGLKINGSSSGSIELDVPDAIGSDVTGVLLPTSAGTLDRLERAGNILQVVFAETSTEVDHTTTSFTDTGLTATITPSSTNSRILVMANQSYSAERSTDSTNHALGLYRDATLIHEGARSAGGGFEYASIVNSSGATITSLRGRASITLVDSPSTTSPVTYKTAAAVNATSASQVVTTQLSGTGANSVSYITLMEIAG